MRVVPLFPFPSLAETPDGTVKSRSFPVGFVALVTLLAWVDPLPFASALAGNIKVIHGLRACSFRLDVAERRAMPLFDCFRRC